jgi:ECF transporter S component (folate family)
MKKLTQKTNITVKAIATIALLAAVSFCLEIFKIPVVAGLDIRFTFILYALVGMLFGPWGGFCFGILGQTLVTLYEGSPFFLYYIPYIVRGVIFGSFLYYKRLNGKITFGRIALAKLFDSLICNLFLNTVISVYYGFATVGNSAVWYLMRLIKNLALYPAECLVLSLIFAGLLRPLKTLKMLPNIEPPKTDAKRIIMLAVISVVAIIVAVLVFTYKDIIFK